MDQQTPSPTIMVIDDDTDLRQLFRYVLERGGYKVLEAANGQAGMELFQKNRVDILVVDIIMPEKDGLETITDIRKKFPILKIIGISGGGKHSSFDYLEIAKMLGAQRTLAKPFKPEILLQAIRELLSESN